MNTRPWLTLTFVWTLACLLPPPGAAQDTGPDPNAPGVVVGRGSRPGTLRVLPAQGGIADPNAPGAPGIAVLPGGPQFPPRRSVFQFGSDYTLPPGEEVWDVTVLFGSVQIDGHVTGDIVVAFGDLEMSPTAEVDRSVTVLGGNLTLSPGAAVGRDIVVFDGTLDPSGDVQTGRERIVTGPIGIARSFLAAAPWITRGLLWGRPIVPDVMWNWFVAGTFLIIYLASTLVFGNGVAICAETLAARPVSTLLAGLAVLLFSAPIAALLLASVVGILILPFLGGALMAAGILGKAGVLVWVGSRVLRREPSAETRLSAPLVVPLLFGFAIVTLVYMIPVIGALTWAMLGILSLGAAAVAAVSRFRSENPPAAPPAAPPPLQDPGTDSPAAPPPDPTPADSALLPRVGFLARTGAFALDLVPVLILSFLLGIEGFTSFFLLLLLYNIALWAWTGTTLGGLILQLRILRTDGAPLRFADALVRGLAASFSIAALGLGCLWVIWDPEKQTWHDRIAGTCLVRVPRDWPAS